MSTYKLTYFKGKGRAEITRKLFKLGDQKFEDERLEKEVWEKMKDSKFYFSLFYLSQTMTESTSIPFTM